MKNILSCRTGSYGRYSSTAYEHLAKIGVKHVEIGVSSLEKVDETLSQLNRFGLSATSLQAPCDISSSSSQNVAEQFKLQCQIASKLGAKVIFTSVKAGDMDRNLAYQRLRQVGDVAKDYGITVAMETHPDMITNADVALQTMKGVNHPNIRVNFDTANIYYYNEGINGVEELKKIIDYIGAIHLKETNGKPRTWYFPALGEGIVNFKETFRILNEKGFYGPFTLEIEGVEGENLTLEQAQERVAKSVNHLREIGCV